MAITIVDTSTIPGQGYASIITKRDAATLMSHITKILKPGSIITTDEWTAYNALAEYAYIHRTVCHKYHFVDPVTKEHTQNVESYNNKLKLALKEKKGIFNDRKQEFCEYFMFCDIFKDDPYHKMIDLLSLK